MAFGPFTQNPNIIILMTDQQRAFRYFPEIWIDQNLPNFRKLQANGMTFNNAICNASRCSPSRSVLYTGQYTWQTYIYDVGGTLPPNIPTIGKLMQQAGYSMVYKGKWHLSGENGSPNVRPVDSNEINTAVENMESSYNIGEWNPPDAGTAGAYSFPTNNAPDPEPTSFAGSPSPYFSLGGSFIMNDDRYVIGPNATNDQQSAIDFLTQYQQTGATNPFCLAVSLVNPHDVNVFPNLVEGMKYDEFRALWQAYKDFKLPPSYYDTLLSKPSVQKAFVDQVNIDFPFSKDFTELEYMQFYAYLHTLPDQLFATLLGTLSEELLNNTLIIRLADHGELSMSHGGMRFKDLNAYQEAINVPMVFSNPILFPKAQSVNQLVGLVDLMPTLASIVGLTDVQKDLFSFKGHDFSSVLLDPTLPTQEHSLFTYDDDIEPGQAGHIRSLVRTDYKFNVYYTTDTVLTSGQPPTGNVLPDTFQYELYDLVNDPSEMNNLLPVNGAYTPTNVTLLNQFYAELTELMVTTGTTPGSWPATVPPAVIS